MTIENQSGQLEASHAMLHRHGLRPGFQMEERQRRHVAITTLLLAVFSVAPCIGQQVPLPSDPSKGFDPSLKPGNRNTEGSITPSPVRSSQVNPAADVIPLPPHGNVDGGKDRGMTNVGVIFGARIYGGNLANAIELFYYVPSNKDNLYREGDYRNSTGRIGGDRGADLGGYYCPEGFAAVGLQGASGLGVDRVGLICGKIGNLSRTVALPVLGGKGGNAFKDICDETYSLGFLTGLYLRSNLWMDSIQGLCQARK